MHDDTCGRCIPITWGSTGRFPCCSNRLGVVLQRDMMWRGNKQHDVLVCNQSAFLVEIPAALHQTPPAHTHLESRMESIKQCIVRQSIPRSSQMQLELTVTQKICSYSPQTSQNLHNVFTDLLKCDDRSCVPFHELGIGIYIRPRYRVNATETSGILLGHSLHA